MADNELRTVKIPGFKEDILVCITHNAVTVHEWVMNVEEYFSLRCKEVEHAPKFLSIAVVPDQPETPAILVIGVERHCLIFQIGHATEIPVSLKLLLENRLYTYVGIGVELALDRLSRYHQIGGKATRSLELSYDYGLYAANGEQPRSFTLKDLCKTKLGREMAHKPAAVTASDWMVLELNDDQIKFTCLDAFVSYQVAMSMSMSAACICEAFLVLLGKGPP